MSVVSDSAWPRPVGSGGCGAAAGSAGQSAPAGQSAKGPSFAGMLGTADRGGWGAIRRADRCVPLVTAAYGGLVAVCGHDPDPYSEIGAQGPSAPTSAWTCN